MTHYEILGVANTASADEIKQAYRKLAKDHHPDRGGDHEHFAQINAAYDILKDPEKRKAYDNPRADHSFSNNTREWRFDTDVGSNFNDLFESMFRQYNTVKNKDLNINAGISLEDVLSGKTLNATFKTSTGTAETVTVVIPPGIKTGDTFRFTGVGDDAHANVARGNLNVRIIVQDKPGWRRDNNHLWVKHEVNVFDLLLGCVIVVTTLEGTQMRVTIPPATKITTVFSVPEYGLPDRSTNKRGNLYVQLDVVVPRITDTESLEHLVQIKNKINKEEK